MSGQGRKGKEGMEDDLIVVKCCDVLEAISCVRIGKHNTTHHDSPPLQVGMPGGSVIQKENQPLNYFLKIKSDAAP